MNPQFLSYLANKLKTGNLKSIHLNALPGRLATRLDLKTLDIIGKNYIENEEIEKENLISNDFLFNNLLAKPKFQFKMNFDEIGDKEIDENIKKQLNLITRKLNSIVNQNEDNYLEHGIKTFSFGYPLLIKRSVKDPSKTIKAPIIIWNIDIKRSNQKQNEWIIEQNEETPIYINEVLISHITSDVGVVIDNLPNEFLEDNIIDSNELLNIVNQILEKLDSDEKYSEISLEECPDKSEIESNIENKANILWSGIFGLFKTQKQSIIRDTENLANIELSDNETIDENDILNRSNNTSVPTDPSQEEIVNTLNQSEYKLIQGPPGTGKSQSLTAIITNTLENGKKILVVCEKKTALDVIYNNLKKLNLHNFAVIIDDVNRDRKNIIDKVRQLSESKEEKGIRFNEQMYDSKLEQYKEMIDDYNTKHHNVLEKRLIGYNTQEIIAEYLKLKRTNTSDERLLLELDFKFNDEEYKELLSVVEQAVDLYDEVPSEAMVYDILSKHNFSSEYSMQSETQIHEKLSKEIEFLKGIRTEYFYLHDATINKLPSNYSSEYNQATVDELTTNIKQLIQYWSNIIKETGKVNIHKDKSNLLNNNVLYKRIAEIYSLRDNVTSHLEDLTKIDEALYLLAINKDKLPNNVGKDFINFNRSNKFNSIFSSKHKAILKFSHYYQNTCEKINRLISNNKLNNTNANLQEIVKDFIHIDKIVDDLVTYLQLCVENKKWYREYHNWRYFFDNISKLEHHCLNLLKKNSVHDKWKDVFKLNYINLFIETKIGGSESFNYNSKAIERIGEMQDELKFLHKFKILKIWEDQADKAIANYNQSSNIKWLFNYRKNSKYAKKNTLRAIIHEEFDLFTDLFPVVLVNPVVCSSIFPLKPDLFEFVLFDEASQLRLEDTYSALIRAKVKVISGDKHQMPPTNYFSSDIALEVEDEEQEENITANYDKTHPLFLAESESLLEFGNNLNSNKINTSFLDYHYRSRHPKLIDFSNAAFYGGRLIPMPAKNEYQPIFYVNVAGEYKKNNTNPDEAKQIIDFLKDKYPVNKNGSYPSLGIATFNMQQRNLIKDLINDSCVADELFREKMNKIGKSEDWFVKNLENIQGDERDIIIISTTFGRNAEGDFRQSFGQINTAKGYKLLNVIITRAKKWLYVFSSIPSEYMSNYQDDIETKGNKGKAILYAYLDYCRAIENNNEAQRLNILKILENACEEEASVNVKKSLSAFKTEVYDYLSKYIKADNLIENYQIGGYNIDFAITNEHGKPIVAIECDGASRHKNEQAFSHDLHRAKIFEMQDFKVYRIWSKAWHPDPDKEIERLLSFLGKTLKPEDCNKLIVEQNPSANSMS